jgi:DNA-binding MurR/RpiR family transcriptional regulator
MDAFERIKKERDNFSKSFGKVADFVCSNYEEVAFILVSEVAHRVGVSGISSCEICCILRIFRFCREMRKNIERRVKNNLKLPNRMLAASLSDESSCQEVMTTVLNKDINNILLTLKNPYNKTFDQVVHDIKEAKRVYIIGTRGLNKVAGLMEFLFDLVGINCIALNAGDSSDYQRILKIKKNKKNCLLIAFLFPRYDRHIHESIKVANKVRARTVVFSDTAFSPDAKIADLTLTINVESNTFINSYCAIISVINVIVTSIGIKYKSETMESLCDIENCLQSFEIDESYSAEF